MKQMGPIQFSTWSQLCVLHTYNYIFGYVPYSSCRNKRTISTCYPISTWNEVGWAYR